MGILNLTPDSFWEPSRGNLAILSSPVDIVDIGAVSSRPGAEPVGEDEEWRRLEPFLKTIAAAGKPLSLDTTRSEIVRRACAVVGPLTVNDISAGEEDPRMLPTVAELGLPFIAMHKRGNPQTMDSLCYYPDGVMAELLRYFEEFSRRAENTGVKDWILDPGLGFAKTPAQNIEILENLEALKVFGRPILVGLSHKRFTRGRSEKLTALAIRNGADILRVHDFSELPAGG